jgi:hypothetical protein
MEAPSLPRLVVSQVDPHDPLFRCFAIFVPIVFLWLFSVTAFSVFRRVWGGKPLFRPRPAKTRFSEQWRSGRSLKRSRFAGASSCLWVTITDEELIVCPHFPFNLAFMPEYFDLEHRIRGSDILSVEHHPSLLGGAMVLVRFRRPDGKEGGIDLALRDAGAFDRAIEAIRNLNAPS